VSIEGLLHHLLLKDHQDFANVLIAQGLLDDEMIDIRTGEHMVAWYTYHKRRHLQRPPICNHSHEAINECH